ncbi:HAD hydrolase family protein [Streptomyces tsukubensis]|uniref:Hydrolase n=1 Tax=Streptomyces tsukubensis TaxID=83656 RepID=A0A1V4A8N0_9ACTN|nr:hydrolase [Streptomyces tsukubensis]
MRENVCVTSVTPRTRPGTSAPHVPPRLIATDLDGTLLRDDKSVSPRTVDALAAAEAAGVRVFFVTGRPARWMDVVSAHVHGHGLAICGNGAAVVDLHSGDGGPRFVKLRPMETGAALGVALALRTAAPGTTFAVERTGGLHHEPGYPPLHLDPSESIAPVDVLLADESPTAAPSRTAPSQAAPSQNPDATPPGPAARSGIGGQPVLKLLAHHPELSPDEFLSLARKAIGDRASVTRSSPTALLEISAHGVSKASTLALCCAELGIGPEEVVAFGDMPNDVEMLTWAGRSYAMGNAHPDVIAAASASTVANNDDGVAVVIERIIAERHAADS